MYRVLFQKILFRRVTNQWNNLPESIVTTPSLDTFKNRLDKLWERDGVMFYPDGCRFIRNNIISADTIRKGHYTKLEPGTRGLFRPTSRKLYILLYYILLYIIIYYIIYLHNCEFFDGNRWNFNPPLDRGFVELIAWLIYIYISCLVLLIYIYIYIYIYIFSVKPVYMECRKYLQKVRKNKKVI